MTQVTFSRAAGARPGPHRGIDVRAHVVQSFSLPFLLTGRATAKTTSAGTTRPPAPRPDLTSARAQGRGHRLPGFDTAARTDPALGDLSRQAAEGTRSLVRRVPDRLEASGVLRPGLDLDVETERLTALLDGLGLGGVLQPSIVDPRTCAEVLRAHLEGLAGPEGAESDGT
ncbi:TetR family transcriptional regulator C-terminal domain-containing protein [Streptomyces sp. NPDC012637]|uniref:TetR family transcriptional regulator C-terminal domain-containing protein n=1 Tax=Streptomyces sp. NPDC012637 TaxID=3364842 RepID=UPI0036E67FFE